MDVKPRGINPSLASCVSHQLYVTRSEPLHLEQGVSTEYVIGVKRSTNSTKCDLVRLF